MNGRKAVVGLCLLCALAFSAVAAQSAMASKGTTAFTCKKTGAGGTFAKAHCKPGEAAGEFSHVAVTQDTTTEITGTNANTNAETNGPEPTILKTVVSGVEVEIKSTIVSGSGSMTNKIEKAGEGVTGEHFIHGTGKIKYAGASMLKPAKCSLEKTEYETKELTATTTAQGDTLKFQPKEGTVFIEFTVVGAECPAGLKGNYPVSGSVAGTPEGATTTFIHGSKEPATGTTGQGTLKVRNVNVAGVEGKLTISGRDPTLGEVTYTPLSATTVETP